MGNNNNNLYSPPSARPHQSCPVRGSRAWSERVLELFDRDRMDDLEELCVLMGVNPVSCQEAE